MRNLLLTCPFGFFVPLQGLRWPSISLSANTRSLVVSLSLICFYFASPAQEIEVAFIQFQGCTGQIRPEVICVYTHCGVNVDDVSIQLDPRYSPDRLGINGNLNVAGGACGWAEGDTSRFQGCNFRSLGPGEFLPASSFLVIQMTANPSDNHWVGRDCENLQSTYVIKNSCTRTEDAFPDIPWQDSVAIVVSTPTTMRRILVKNEGRRDITSPIEYWMADSNHELRGQACGNQKVIPQIHFYPPQLQVSSVVVEQPSCGSDSGEIRITASSNASEYSIDGGRTWSQDPIFTNLAAGIYKIRVRAAGLGCVVDWYRDVRLDPAMTSDHVIVFWRILPDSVCGGREAELHVGFILSHPDPPVDTSRYEFSIDGGQNYQDSWRFLVRREGNYQVAIRDRSNPDCVISVDWQLGDPPEPPIIVGLTQDSLGFCQSSFEIDAIGTDLEFSLDNQIFQDSPVFPVRDDTTLTVYARLSRDKNCLDSSQVTVETIEPLQGKVEVSADSVIATVLSGSAGPYTFRWSNGAVGPGLYLPDLASGEHYVTITDRWGCKLVYSYVKDAPCAFPVVDSVHSPGCAIADGSIHLTNLGPDSLSYDWSVDRFDGNSYMDHLGPGLYQVTLRYGANCETTRSYHLGIDNPTKVFVNVEPITCQQQNGKLSVSQVEGGQRPFTLHPWGVTFDSILTMDGLAVGTHSYVLTDATGCSYRDTFEIEDHRQNIMVDFTIDQPDCIDEHGSFEISQITGGTKPYTLDLNGSSSDIGTVTLDLPEGKHVFSVFDQNGCFVTDSFSIKKTKVKLDIIADTTTLPGVPVHLAAYLDTSDLHEYFWASDQEILCRCTSYWTLPTKSSHYQFTATHDNGCSQTQTVYVTVAQEKRIFIPNAFTPNADNRNDVLEVYLPEGIELLQFDIFDRWGNICYRTLDRVSWHGQEMQAGTYVYQGRFRDNLTGEFHLKTGTIQLMR